MSATSTARSDLLLSMGQTRMRRTEEPNLGRYAAWNATWSREWLGPSQYSLDQLRIGEHFVA